MFKSGRNYSHAASEAFAITPRHEITPQPCMTKCSKTLVALMGDFCKFAFGFSFQLVIEGSFAKPREGTSMILLFGCCQHASHPTCVKKL